MSAVRAAAAISTVRAVFSSHNVARQRLGASSQCMPSLMTNTATLQSGKSSSPSGYLAMLGATRRRMSLAAAADGSASVSVESTPAAAAAPEEKEALVHALDIRVGRILKAWRHPEADSLYVEEVDVGEEEGPRTICSGLVKYVPEEELQGRAVLVLTNLKPRNMRGVKSNGMLLAASDAAHENVELLNPPEGATPGERVWFGREDEQAAQPEAMTANQVQKKKVWEAVQPELKTTEDGVAVFRGRPMRTAVGVASSKTLKNANIS